MHGLLHATLKTGARNSHITGEALKPRRVDYLVKATQLVGTEEGFETIRSDAAAFCPGNICSPGAIQVKLLYDVLMRLKYNHLLTL